MFIICKKPYKRINKWNFLESHLDCDCIIDIENEEKTKKVFLLAYAEKKEDNDDLYKYFLTIKDNKETYRLLQGIDSREVNSIDVI